MFAAIFNLQAEPVDTTAASAEGCWVETFGNGCRAAIVHSNVAAYGAPGEPCATAALGGRYWIAGRVRLNARGALRARLAGQIGAQVGPMPDALLCLHAYAAWGERCVESMSGDFAFVLWDDDRQCLIAVRDQLGTRALFHARVANTWYVSDSLDWMIGRAGMSRALDDYWIADLLTLGFSREFERTVYRDIQRLAPAHVLRLTETGPLVRRYWRMQIAEPIHFSDRATYAERFRELVSEAIADRLPPGRVGISMSGGLDSTTLAACAVEIAGSPSRVVAETSTDREFAHLGEEHFAALAARHLGIEWRVEDLEASAPDPDWRSSALCPPEPMGAIVSASQDRRMLAAKAGLAAVWFDGEGPDNALVFERDAYLAWLVRRHAWGRLGGALAQYVRTKGLRGWWQTAVRYSRLPRDNTAAALLPRWLNPDFASRLHLVERIQSLGNGGDSSHPWHPEAMASFTSAIWQSHFADFDFLETLGPVVWRHPYLDVRVLEYLLSVPPVPWAWKKQLVREAMRGRLPPELLAREKTPIPRDIMDVMKRVRFMPEFMAKGPLAAFVDVRQISEAAIREVMAWPAMPVFVLDHWLALQRP